MQAKDQPQNLIPKEKAHWNTSWARLLEFEVSTKLVASQSLFANPINRVMFMKQIFQDINNQMLEITYTLKIGQLLKITPNLKKCMW